MASDVCADYEASLEDLKINSKPLINMLTMLADENREHAVHIVRLVEKRILKAQGAEKLPSIYLMDSIIKNVKGGPYLGLFSKNVVQIFCGVFEKVDEKIRTSLFKLRSTWNDYFSASQLYALDMKVKQVDPAWPIQAAPPQQVTPTTSTSIHVNPKFIKKQPQVQAPAVVAKKKPDVNDLQQKEHEMRQNLVAKQQELLQIHKQRLELELQQTKAKLQEQAIELERKNLEIQRQKILQQQQHQVLAVQAAMATADASTPVASVLPTSRLAAPPSQAVNSAPAAIPSVAPKENSYDVASAGWGSTQITPPQPGSDQPPSLFEVISKRADPRTAASQRDPRLASRDPRIRAQQPPSQPQPAQVGKKLPVASKPAVPVSAAMPVSAPAPTKPTPVPPKKLQDPRLNKSQIHKTVESTTKAQKKPAQEVKVKAVVPPVKKIEDKQNNKVLTKTHVESKKLQEEVKIDLTVEDDAPKSVTLESKPKKKDGSHSPRDREGSRDGSRSPRGSKTSRNSEKRKDAESRSRNERTSTSSRRSSRSTRSRSRSRSPLKSRSPPPRRTSKYGRSSRRRGSDEKERSKDRKDDRERFDKERKEDKAKLRDRKDEIENRENRDIRKLGRIPRKSDIKRDEDNEPALGSKRKSEGRGPIERDIRKPWDLEDPPLMKRPRYERPDYPDGFPVRGGRFRRGRGAMRGGFYERDIHPYHGPYGEMVSPHMRRRRSSIDPSVVIPKELSRDKMSAILTQADRQLHSGQITPEEHRELLSQLEELNQFQKNKEEESSPPERMHFLFGERNEYNYRLGGGRPEREKPRVDREDLPESDDSFVIEIARKLEYQKRMAGPRVIEPVEPLKKETPQEKVDSVTGDVDLRVFDPNFQKMVTQQKEEDMSAAGAEEKQQSPKVPGPAKDETVSQEVGLDKVKAPDREESLAKIAKSSDEKADTTKDPGLVPMETDSVSSPSSGKDEKDTKDSLQVVKDSEPIQISPMSPPPEDRDERLTAVVGEKPPDEEETAASDVKSGPSKGVDEGKPTDPAGSNSSNEVQKNRTLSKDVDDRVVEMEVSDVDERRGVVKNDVDEREVKPKDVDLRESEKEDIDERQLKPEEKEKKKNEEKHVVERKPVIKDIDERAKGDKHVVENSDVKSQKVDEVEKEIGKVSMDTDEKLPQGPVQKQTMNKEEAKDSERAVQGDIDQRKIQKNTKEEVKAKVEQEEPTGKEKIAAGSNKKQKSARERKKRKTRQAKAAIQKKEAGEKKKSESKEKEKEETPPEDDLLPAAFRDEVDPNKVKKGALVDQDLRDMDLRNIHRPPEGELLRARSWSDVPTDFFDAEGKRGADVQEVRHDVDLRSTRDPRAGRRLQGLEGGPGPRRPSQIPSLLSLPDPFEHPQRGKKGPPGQEPIPPRRRGGREDPNLVQRFRDEDEAYYRRMEEEERKYGPIDDEWRHRRGTPPPEFLRRRSPPPEFGGPDFGERPGPRGHPPRMRGPRMRGPRHQLYDHHGPRGFPIEDRERMFVERMQRQKGLVRRGKEGSPFEGRYDPLERPPRPRHLPPPEFDDRLPRRVERPEDFEERERYDEERYPPQEYLDREMDPRRPLQRMMGPADPRRREFVVGLPPEEYSPHGSPLHIPEHLQEPPLQPGRLNRPDFDHGAHYSVPPDGRPPPEGPLRVREPSPPNPGGALPYDPYQPGIPTVGSVYQNVLATNAPVSQEGIIGLPSQLPTGQPIVNLGQGPAQYNLPHSMPPVQPSTSFVGPPELSEQPQPYGLLQPFPSYVPTPQPVTSGPVTSANFMVNLPQGEPEPTSAPPLKSQVDINDLLSKLMSSGILAKPQSPAPEARNTPPLTEKEEKPDDSKPKEESAKEDKEAKEEKTPEENEKPSRKSKVNLPEELTLPREKRMVPPLSLDSSDLKQRYAGVIYSLISGTQCSSCGMRFSIDMMSDYRQHLDWHFRQNRKDKDGIKSATSRKWYYEVDEWLLFEEIDASEEGYRSAFFEQQAMEASALAEQEGAGGVPVTGIEEDEYCKICQEPFEQYWDEDDETWMLRDAMKVNNKTYHPTCFEDLKSSSIFGESSSSFHGIPGVGDDGTLPGLGSPDHDMEEEEQVAETVPNVAEVEDAKQKLAEILKPKPEIKQEQIEKEAKIKLEPGTEATVTVKVEMENEEKLDSEQNKIALVKKEPVVSKTELKSEPAGESIKQDKTVKNERVEGVTDTNLSATIKTEPMDSAQSNPEELPVATPKGLDNTGVCNVSASAIVSQEPEKMEVDPLPKEDVKPAVKVGVVEAPQDPAEPMETSQEEDISANVKLEPVEVKSSEPQGEENKHPSVAEVVENKVSEAPSVSVAAEEKTSAETVEVKSEQVIPSTDAKSEATLAEEQKDAEEVKEEEKAAGEDVQSKESTESTQKSSNSATS